MEKKYKLTEETIQHEGRILHRIEALRDFSDVKAGDKGGYVESENNLSHEGKAWVYENALVCGSAQVFGEAKVYENAQVGGKAMVWGEAKVCGEATIDSDIRIYGNAVVGRKEQIEGKSLFWGNGPDDWC